MRLPAMDATPRDRVATPAEFAALLAVLPIEDALPYALAGYGTARHQEVRTLEEGRKPGGSWRIGPLVKPLRIALRKAWIAQGRPSEGKVCPPRRNSASGLLDVSHVQRRVHERWIELGMEPIGLHESRHTAAITLRRCTHTLPGELERARDLLHAFLAERTKTRRVRA